MVLTVDFELDGQRFTALNGGPEFAFNEAISFLIRCADQQEVDHYWNALTDGGEPGPCGWLKDRFGVSWQVSPVALEELLSDPRATRAMTAMLQMGKIDIAELFAAADSR
jgi:predicted 3-demethylubiquinone-9 3-methyltransferase (glyoxalase superfamily)